ncbi:MAG: response regulator [Burkholderiales bacterium]|jgi:CheY-like chemotaxis protein
MKVLIVDDQEINRILPKTHLERLGIPVEEADDGPAALLKLAHGGFDVVLLDISMPGLSGLDVCRQVRADPALKGLKLIAYTAHAFPQATDEIMSAGFDDLLVKPIRRDVLLKALGLPVPVPPPAPA